MRYQEGYSVLVVVFWLQTGEFNANLFLEAGVRNLVPYEDFRWTHAASINTTMYYGVPLYGLGLPYHTTRNA